LFEDHGRIVVPILVPVEDGGEHLMHVGRRADEEEDDEEERLEVEEGGLDKGLPD
jgi:hypothetical protein